MPVIASVSVKYGRKFPLRRDDWVNLEALVTLTVTAEEAELTDPNQLTHEAFAIARQAVREQAQELRRQQTEIEQRAQETPPPQPAEPVRRQALAAGRGAAVQRNGQRNGQE